MGTRNLTLEALLREFRVEARICLQIRATDAVNTRFCGARLTHLQQVTLLITFIRQSVWTLRNAYREVRR